MKTLEEALARIATLEKEKEKLVDQIKEAIASITEQDKKNEQLTTQIKAMAAAKLNRPLLDEAGEKLLATKIASGLPLETALEVVKAQQANDAQKKKNAKG